MTRADFRRGITEALDEELERDDRVVLFGEDIAKAGGVFQVTRGLYEKFGGDRVVDTPIAELALSSAAFGAAAVGLRPVIEVMFADFMALAMDSLINQAAKYWYLSNGQKSIPLTVRSTVGGGGQFGAIHSQIPIPWLQAIPGLKIVAPAFPSDAKGLLKAAIRDEDPVIFFEHKRLYPLQGDLENSNGVVPLGAASVVRPGSHLTIVTAMKSVHDSLAAADALAPEGIDVEIVDLRTLRPVDVETVITSVHKTNRLLVVEEGPRTGGWAGEILAIVAENALEHIDDIWRLTLPDLPLPYSPPLEKEVMPGTEKIVQTVLSHMGNSVSA